ncbi:MAG: prepilin-type N-terminal cleavage/methylation domain-containing protein [Planctomycetota bacterium]|jgi:prepilin-type N-terminal cleavage/methylation domain-containing protein
MTRRAAGFTLIEVLVVMTIVAALMGMVVLLVGHAGKTKEMTITTQRLNGIRAGVEHLRQPHLYGLYPTAAMDRLKGLKGEDVGSLVGISNRTNVGIETLYVALFLSTHDYSIADLGDDWLANTDGDQMKGNPTRSESTELFEFVDAWGNPFAYFSQWDYQNPEGLTEYTMEGGEQVKVVPWKMEKTGQFQNPSSFQLFSAGPDEIFNTDDDIGNW